MERKKDPAFCPTCGSRLDENGLCPQCDTDEFQNHKKQLNRKYGMWFPLLCAAAVIVLCVIGVTALM